MERALFQQREIKMWVGCLEALATWTGVKVSSVTNVDRITDITCSNEDVTLRRDVTSSLLLVTASSRPYHDWISWFHMKVSSVTNVDRITDITCVTSSSRPPHDSSLLVKSSSRPHYDWISRRRVIMVSSVTSVDRITDITCVTSSLLLVKSSSRPHHDWISWRRVITSTRHVVINPARVIMTTG